MIIHHTQALPIVRDFESFWGALRQLLPLPQTPPTLSDPPSVVPTPLEEPLQLSLQKIMAPDRVHCDSEWVRRYAADDSYEGYLLQQNPPQYPAAVVMPNNEQELAQLIAWTAEREFRLLPWGGGKSPYHGKQSSGTPFIVVDLQYLKRVLEIDPQRRLIRAQSGITWVALEEALNPQKLTTGQCFSRGLATLGGSIARQSVNIKSLRYGSLAENVQAIRALCPSGPIRLHTARPGAADERALMLGAHGGWGIISDVTLRLYSSPQERLTLMTGVPSWNEALAAVKAILSAELRPAAIRITTARELSLFGSESSSGLRQLLRAFRGGAPAEIQILLDLEGTREGITTTRRHIEELLYEKRCQITGNGYEAQQRKTEYRQRQFLLRQLWERRILAHTLTAAVPWDIAAAFLRDWEEALRSILLTTGGQPGQTLSTLWATPDYALLHTLLLGHQAEAPAARMAQLQDIQAVALAAKQRWQIEEPASALVQQAQHAAGEQLDPEGIMMR